VIYADDSVIAIPGLGPQVYPYVLVVTRRHFSGFADSTPSERQALLDALHALLSLGIYPSQSLCVFEHGGCGGMTIGCIDHCHMHVVDGAFALHDALAARVVDVSPASLSATEVLRPADRYLFAGPFGGGRCITGVLTHVIPPSRQYFRQLLAAELGSDEWDWSLRMNEAWVLRLVAEVAAKTGAPQRRPD
jgi:hypothetical protein